MKKLSLVSLALAAACTSQTAGNQSGRLQASADAQHVGIYAYAVDADVVTLYDRDGIEAGRVAVSSPAADRRVFNIELADGTLDDAEVYRPLDGNRFVAPVTPETALTAAMADPALASTWAAHQVRFTVDLLPRLRSDLTPSATLATTGSCVGTDPNHNNATCTSNCDWQSDSPAGCARPANLNAGCSNPSQLPATIAYNNTAWQPGLDGMTQTSCLTGAGPLNCKNTYGGSTSDYVAGDGTLLCTYNSVDRTWSSSCLVGTSGNSWTSSCPRSTCGTVGDYDAVPRLRACNQPGSCTKSQGTVGCTPYH